MKRALIALMIGSLSASAALAQCHATGEKKEASGAACAATCSTSKSECCQAKSGVALAKASIPRMKYAVGDATTCCPQEAQTLAKGDAKAIRFVVGESKFESEAEAQGAYAKALDSYLGEITSVKYAVGKECVACPMSAQELAKKEGQPLRYRLASFDFASREKADDAAKSARAAAENIHLAMMVGEKSFECPMSAADTAKSEGKKVEYCVNGKKSECKSSANVELALAKIDAALTALEKANQS